MMGQLIYLVGASGSGKDSLIQYARERLEGDPFIQFVHRYITRPAHAGGENHIALTPGEFASRREAGLFALHWYSHGLCYGIGTEINGWLEKGVTVVINGSRAYLPEAQIRYPNLVLVNIEVSADVLLKRLIARDRETHAEIKARMDRHQEWQLSRDRGETINNDGDIGAGGDRLVRLIQRYTRVTTCV